MLSLDILGTGLAVRQIFLCNFCVCRCCFEANSHYCGSFAEGSPDGVKVTAITIYHATNIKICCPNNHFKFSKFCIQVISALSFLLIQGQVQYISCNRSELSYQTYRSKKNTTNNPIYMYLKLHAGINRQLAQEFVAT